MSNARKLADNLPSEGQLSNRNLIINGAMQVNQRGNQTGLTANVYGIDRFKFVASGRDQLVYSFEQDSDVPSGSGFSKSLKYTTTTAESAIGASEYFFISQRIEAQNCQHLAYGTSSAKKVTLSFWVKSSVTGTFCVGLYKDDGAGSLTPQVHNKTYTISSASTWEHKTITFEANTLTGGGITDDTGIGLYVSWHLAAGSSYDSGSSTSSGWADYTTTNWCAPSTTDAVATTTNATFYLTGVQLEVGPQSTPFEHEPVGVTLRKCQRYYEAINPADRTQGKMHSGDNKQCHFSLPFKVTKRVTPQVVAAKCAASSIYDGTNSRTSGFTFDSDGSDLDSVTFRVRLTSALSGTQYRNLAGYGLTCHVDAEL